MAGRVAYYGGIVKDGLVLNLDAAKRDSYPGTGTIWRDISGNQKNFTLSSATYFQTPTGSYFSGNSSGLANSLASNPTQFTIDFAMQATAPAVAFGNYVGTGGGVGNLSVRGSNGNPAAVQLAAYAKNTSNADIVIFNSAGSQFTPGFWTIYTATFSSTGVATIYIRGTSAFTSTVTNFSFWNFNTANTFFFQGGLLANLKIYNRALSAQEVLQNYNATKGRYGL